MCLRPGATASLRKCKFSGPSPELLNKKFWGQSQAICFNSPVRWFWCTLTFDNHCNKAVFFQLFWLRSTGRNAFWPSNIYPPLLSCVCTHAKQNLQETVIHILLILIFYILFYFISLKNCWLWLTNCIIMFVVEFSAIKKWKEKVFRRLDKWIILYFYNGIHCSLYH